MIKKTIYILVLGLLWGGNSYAKEIIIKDCATIYSSLNSEFDKKKYTHYYFNINPKNQTISEVWSYTDSYFKEAKREKSGIQKINVVNWTLVFLDNNFATAEKTYGLDGYKNELTIDLKKYIVAISTIIDFKNVSQSPLKQCKK